LYPASKMCNNISCILYIDDNNIIHLSEYDSGTAREALMALQDNITSWSNLLVATRSTLKPPKSFIYLLSYTWDTKGKWSYAKNHTNPAFSISVTLPDGTTAPIQHLSVHTAMVTLGGSTCPSGQPAGMIHFISTKACDWSQLTCNSGKWPRDFHISVERKFWPRIQYGLCANTSPFRTVNGKETGNATGSLSNRGRLLWRFTRHYRKAGDDGRQGTIQLRWWDCGAMDTAMHCNCRSARMENEGQLIFCVFTKTKADKLVGGQKKLKWKYSIVRKDTI
jgi:hypothetical protein